MNTGRASDPSFGRLRGEARSDFEMSHTCILTICLELEDFADALPNRLDPERCRQLADAMSPLLKQCHAAEEKVIGSMDGETLCMLEASISRLRMEHLRDQYFAEDIAEALRQVSEVRPLANPEALGFMMQSFFEAQRRHVAFEQEHILPRLAD